ncbi:MAG: Fic family protein [Candidatus Cloacimonetes bacterium]|nr:Fic family protein [Candidatus Cloacimonadota bacterium]
MMSKFKHLDLRLVRPAFDSEIIDLIIELDYLRKKKLYGSTHPQIFFQLKQIFHMLESLGSARIEGNHTTIADYVEEMIDKEADKNESMTEIINMENALGFIDEQDDIRIDRIQISDLHRTVVKNLIREGSTTPGDYRRKNVVISGSEFSPPDYTKVADYMEELIGFINSDTSPKYDLIKTAIAHHRFTWIHPFDNGNGRTVRLFTYAMLVKFGFNVKEGRLLNPTAVFCSDRNKYYQYLTMADSGTNDGMLAWCNYVLAGLKSEIEKIDNLLDYKFTEKLILIPAIRFSQQRELITDTERKILEVGIKKQDFQNSDIQDVIEYPTSRKISREIAKLREKGFIQTERNSQRKYVVNFSQNCLLRGVIDSLRKNGFIPASLDE